MDNSSFVPIHMVSFVVRCTACSLKHSLWIINAFGVWRISLRWTTWNVLSEKRIAILSLINTYGENKLTPYGLVSTSDGVGVVRAPITKWKSNIGVVSGVISTAESESEESERFLISSDSAYESIPYVPLTIFWRLETWHVSICDPRYIFFSRTTDVSLH